MVSLWSWFFTVFMIFAVAKAQNTIKIMALTESTSASIPQKMSDAVSLAQKKLSGRANLDLEIILLERDTEEESQKTMCGKMSEGASLVVDLTWSGWYEAKVLCESAGLPYVRADVTIRSYVKALNDFLTARNGTDAALIFQTEEELDQALYYMIGNSIIRIIVLNGLDDKNIKGLFDMRPTPSFHAIFGKSAPMREMIPKAIQGGLMQRNGRWNFILTDFHPEHMGLDSNVTANMISMQNQLCCRILGMGEVCTCNSEFDMVNAFMEQFGILLGSILFDMINELEPQRIDCDTVAAANSNNDTRKRFDSIVEGDLSTHPILGYNKEEDLVYIRLAMDISILNKTQQTKIATWNTETGFALNPGQELEENRRFFRIGVIDEDEPWSYREWNDTIEDYQWKGYCIDLAEKLADEMKFDFEFSKPREGKYGKKQKNGKWDGLVGDLARGETDIVVAALMMTSEREEVIDFVAPYFDQSGISIMIRKPVRPTSLFKFMTVLRVEVWVSIVGALTVTGIMIWLLDKYSPYSARNNKEMYPYPCREFTLKESFWFALTSFTPQGGGEAPKALSGRTLVAAYWLFVVLMLATFTANLAAFLTVERMKTPVESLEQLARQSRINYTVVENGDAHNFFRNMKAAEDTLYQKWKELTLNASSDQTQYRVWDYPIKEQFGHILLAIDQTGPVPNETAGIERVLAREDGDFAFIHDAAAVKYQVYKNCNLTEVGEVFAERPYAVAVQQGSQLQEEISRKILDLQKDRYFETESAKYWNPQAAGKCPNTDDSEGITLGSLGGVFIATLFGLALAMVTLAGEILYHKHKHTIDKALKDLKPGKKSKVDTPGMVKSKFKDELKDVKGRMTLGEQQFRNFRSGDTGIPKVSYISVFPRNTNPYD